MIQGRLTRSTFLALLLIITATPAQSASETDTAVKGDQPASHSANEGNSENTSKNVIEMRGGLKLTISKNKHFSLTKDDGNKIKLPAALEQQIDKMFLAERRHAGKPAFAILSGENGVTVVNDQGQLIKLNLNLKSLGWAKDSEIVAQEFNHDGHTYLLLSVKSNLVENRYVLGEAHLIRADGIHLRVGYGFPATTNTIKIHDGILDTGFCARKIDLNRFAAEAKFVPKPPSAVLDDAGRPIGDVTGEARKYFSNMLGEIASDSVFTVEDDATTEAIRFGLNKVETSSVAVLGEAGSGKTERIKNLIARIGNSEFPEIPRTIQVIRLDAATLSQGTKYASQFETRVKLLLEIIKAAPTILFVDEVQSLRGQGTHEHNSNDVFQYLKTGLADGTVRIIATSTESEFYQAFGGDGALLRRFVVIHQPNPERKQVIQSVKSWLKRYNKATLSDDMINSAIDISEMYNSVGAQPAKVTALLDYSYSYLDIQKRDQRILTRQTLDEAAQRLYGISKDFYDGNLRAVKLARLRPALDMVIIGQSEFKDVLVQQATQFYTGVQDRSKPAIRILVAGPPGTGKTATVYAYANYLGLPLKHIEMTKYSTAIDTQQFLSEIALALRTHPFSVLLFDEFEKASPAVRQAMLGMMDNGSFTVKEHANNSSQSGSVPSRINAQHTTIIATTNAGTSYIRNTTADKEPDRSPMGFPVPSSNDTQAVENQQNNDDQAILNYKWNQQLRNHLINDGIEEPILDRFQHLVASYSPTKEEFRAVLDLHLSKAIEDLNQRHQVKIDLTNKEPFLNAATAKFYQDGMSNRVALDIVQNYFLATLAQALLQHEKLIGKKQSIKVVLSLAASSASGNGSCESGFSAH